MAYHISTRIRLVAGSALFALGMAVPAASALAQTAGSAASAADEGGIADIVVTAQKRSETAQSVPAAVIAITGDQLASQGVVDARQLSSLVPSARFEQVRSQVQVTVRGVGQSNSGPNADAAVATNLNGIYQLNDMTGAAFFDVDRVEVLPGPQGTLYGRNAAGGAVNVSTRRPGHDLAANMSLELGNYKAVNAEAGIDLPVTDTLAIRAAGGVQRHDGYLSNGGNDRDTAAGRLTMVYEPTSRLSVVLVGSYTQNDGMGDQVVNKPSVRPDDPYYYPFSANGRFSHDKIYTISGELNYALTDDINFTYLGGYDHFKRHQFLDLDAQLTPLIVQTQDITQRGTFWSHEARLSGDTGPVKWIAGVYYYDSDQFYSNIVNIPGRLTVLQTPINVYAKGVAGFGQVTYSLTDSLRVTGGLRYSHDKKNGAGDFTVVTPGGTIPSPFAGRVSDSRLDWKAGVEADIARDSLAYATVQTGFNQGGFSFAPASIGGGNLFEPVKLTAYTAGIKNRFADRTIQLNLEGYYYDYKNYQVSARDLASGLNVIYNAQKAKVYGAQAEAAFQPTPADKLFVTAGVLHAEATTLILPAGVGGQRDFSGYALPGAPHLTASGSYEHVFTLANGATITPRVAIAYTGARWSAYNHFVGSRLPDFSKTDIQLTYAPSGGAFSVQAFVRNLFDKAVYTSVVSANLPGPAAGFLEPPRTYGVRLSANF